MNIDFTPTAYTVKSPADGMPRRYEYGTNAGWLTTIETARRHFIELAGEYPNLARFVVPDHYVQEVCRLYDCNLYGGGGGYRVDRFTPFFRLAETGLSRA